MAKISEEIILIRVSTLVRGEESAPVVFTDEIKGQLEQVIGQMVQAGQIVEVIDAS